jgi:hypothetical protein
MGGRMMVNNQVFNSVIKIKKDASDHVYYHNARKLVEIYRSVTWGLQYNFDEMTDACKDMGYSDIEEALCFVEDGTVDGNAIRYMEDRTLSMKYTNLLVYIIERALLALRDYPDKGEYYYSLLYQTYFAKYPLEEIDLLEEMNISRSTFYRAKKKAVSLLGAIIWGYMLPLHMKTQKA